MRFNKIIYNLLGFKNINKTYIHWWNPRYITYILQDYLLPNTSLYLLILVELQQTIRAQSKARWRVWDLLFVPRAPSSPGEPFWDRNSEWDISPSPVGIFKSTNYTEALIRPSVYKECWYLQYTVYDVCRTAHTAYTVRRTVYGI